MNWPDEHIEILRERWGIEPAKVIAQKLGRTTSSVITKANRMGLAPISRETRLAWLKAGFRESDWAKEHMRNTPTQP